MNEKDRNTIRANIHELSLLIDLESVEPLVVNKRIFTPQMMQNIMEIPREQERNKYFLIDLTRRGPDAYEAFVETLLGTGQIEAARILKPDTIKDAQSVEDVIEIIVAEAPPDSGGGGDELSSNESGHTVATIEDNNNLVQVERSKNPMIGSSIYDMTSDPRGYCLIINNMQFDRDILQRRIGSDVEAERLKQVFTDLHFQVVIKENLTKEEMENTFEEYSKKPDLKKHNAIIVMVLTHGYSRTLVGTDGIGYEFRKVINKFNNENCPLLINKPKLFFFNCCRGIDYDHGPKGDGAPYFDTVPDSKATLPLPHVPTLSDIMVCYSTLDGFVSWRNEDTGSWFGTALSKALMKYASDTELHHILIHTSNMINNKTTQEGARQAMEHRFLGWKKFLYFNPGFPSEEIPET